MTFKTENMFFYFDFAIFAYLLSTKKAKKKIHKFTNYLQFKMNLSIILLWTIIEFENFAYVQNYNNSFQMFVWISILKEANITQKSALHTQYAETLCEKKNNKILINKSLIVLLYMKCLTNMNQNKNKKKKRINNTLLV